MGLQEVEEWVKAHPFPSAAIGGVGLALVFAVVKGRSKGAATQAQQYAIPNLLPTAGTAFATTPAAPMPVDSTPWWMIPTDPLPPAPITSVTTAPQQPSQSPYGTSQKIGISSNSIIGLPNGVHIGAGLVAPSQGGVSYVNPDTIIYNPTGGSETAQFSQFYAQQPTAVQDYLRAIATGA